MWTDLKLPVLLLAAATLFLQQVSAYECYTCNHDDPGCEDDLGDVTTTCRGRACRKLIDTSRGLGGYRISRDCIREGESDRGGEGCYHTRIDGRGFTICVCRSEMCNTSHRVASNALMALCACVMASIVYYVSV